MDYNVLKNKTYTTDSIQGEEIKDLLTLTFIIPDNIRYSVFKVTQEYVARPDLVSFDYYGSTDYTDIICKLNGLSNPFELNVDMLILLPDPMDLTFFNFSDDRIETSSSSDSVKPIPKTRKEKRKANEATEGDSRYRIDAQKGIVIY